ncbi:MAG: hypothetical protein IPG96_15610 [Proteobacteria bacterium]|nr:hypothetical protein [Pseudomonadota bacterium]
MGAGDVHTCGVRTDQTLVCWGSGSFGGATEPLAGAFTSVAAGLTTPARWARTGPWPAGVSRRGPMPRPRPEPSPRWRSPPAPPGSSPVASGPMGL